MDYRIPDNDSQLDSIDRREQDKEDLDAYAEAADEDLWDDNDDDD